MSTATELLDRVTRGRADKLLRYSGASVVGVVLTQALLVLFVGILNEDAELSNLAAVMLTSVPVFYLNKRWVWGKAGRARMRREVLPFWGFTLLGLVVSTVLVTVVDNYSDRTWPVLVANVAGFGIVWVAKFLFLDAVVFGIVDEEEPAA
ncbi:MAG TPA: GtrA family protein [Acidimicrobiales bacterium]|nr:GtrA family protein [Acidimicrobiales bacterium]